MLFGLFRNREVEEAGKAMAERFAKRFPPELQDDDRPGAAQKRESAMSGIYSEVGDLRKRAKLGVLGKATLANTLKWSLKERGYRPDVIKQVVYDMLFHIAGRK
ncbi:MAG TPA: hypothetical protein VFO66_09230 [Gemmatimonadaceae bacterium]|jgi:hypothetical protein|nr:hypothetical protein [Gemmatimonadaceae bacterium]